MACSASPIIICCAAKVGSNNLGIDPGSLIHALQNHDELTLELVHFWTLHANDTFLYQGQTFPGNILREHIREQMYERLAGEHAPYNLKFVTMS